MRHLRFSSFLALLAALAGAGSALAQGGITDVMRGSGAAAGPGGAPAAKPAAPVLGQRPAEYIVALVNSEPITNTEVQTKIARALQRGGPEVERIPRDQLARIVLERLISEKAQYQQAKEMGIKVDEPAIDQAEQMVARQNQIPVTEMRRRLAADGITRDAFRAELRQQIALQRLRERTVEPRVKVSDLEVDQYLQEKRQSGKTSAPAQINIAHVLVAVPEDATPAQVEGFKQRAEDIVKRARAGEDFAALARTLSDAPDRANGGALGQQDVSRYPPLFIEATQSSAVGDVAGPVRSGAGFHVLKLLARAQAGAGGPVVVQSHVRHILLRTDGNNKRTTEQAVAQLADFKKRIEAGTAGFAGLARDNSEDGSAKEGGDLGWSRPGMFVPEFEEAMARLSPGQISDPVVSRYGVHLIQLVERRESTLSEGEQREAALAELRDKRLEDAYTTWAQEVRDRAYVEFREPPQ